MDEPHARDVVYCPELEWAASVVCAYVLPVASRSLHFCAPVASSSQVRPGAQLTPAECEKVGCVSQIRADVLSEVTHIVTT